MYGNFLAIKLVLTKLFLSKNITVGFLNVICQLMVKHWLPKANLINLIISGNQIKVMSACSFTTSTGGETRGARDDERQNPIIPVQPINGVCCVYIAPLPAREDIELFCRICHDTKCENNTPLISPCRCTGSAALVHQECMENWLTISGRESCDLCNYRLPVYRTMKPIREVRKDVF